MPNITVTVDESIYRNVRVWAAIHNTTVSGLVRRFFQMITHDSIDGHEPQQDLPAGRLEDLAATFNRTPEMPGPGQNPAENVPSFLNLLMSIENE
jgi:hypothetical protein